VCDQDQNALAALAQSDPELAAFACDVSDAGAVEALYRAVEAAPCAQAFPASISRQQRRDFRPGRAVRGTAGRGLAADHRRQYQAACS